MCSIMSESEIASKECEDTCPGTIVCVNDHSNTSADIGEKESELLKYVQCTQQNTKDSEGWPLCCIPLKENVITFTTLEGNIVIAITDKEIWWLHTLILAIASGEKYDTNDLFSCGSGLYLSSCDMKSIVFVLSIITKLPQPIQIYMTGKLPTQLYSKLYLQSYTSGKPWNKLSIFVAHSLCEVNGIQTFLELDIPYLEMLIRQSTIKESRVKVNGSFGFLTIATFLQTTRILQNSHRITDNFVSGSELQTSAEHCNWILIQDVLFFAMFQLLFSGFRFDVFFALCSNAVMNSCKTVAFTHLPFVPGELITIQSLLYDASYCHESNSAFFLKVAFRAEVAVTYILSHGEALQFYRYCVQVAVNIGDQIAEARMLIVYGQLLGQCKKCLGLGYLQYRRALELLEPRGKCIDLAWLFTLTGWNLFSRGVAIGGKEYLIQAYDMLQELLKFSTNTFRQSSLFSLGPSLMEEEEKRLEQKLAATASSLGLVLLHSDNPQEALKYLEESLRLRQRLWLQHPAIGSTLNNMSLCYQRLGDHSKALDYSRKGLTVKRQFKGNCKEMVNSLNNVALNCSLVSSSYEEAIEYLGEALLIQQKLGLDTSDTATIYTSLAFVYQQMGRLDAALLWYQKAVDIRRDINGIAHPTTLRLVVRCGSILFQMRRYDETKYLLETQIVKSPSNCGDELTKLVELLGQVYLKTGEDAKAASTQKKSLQDFIDLLREQTNKKGTDTETRVSSQTHLVNDDTENMLQTNVVTTLDDIDSDDDLYGPEDSSLTEVTTEFQGVKSETGDLQMLPSNKKLAVERSQSEEDIYCSSKGADGHMSNSASPELVSVDADDGNNMEVEYTESPTLHHAEITNSIRSNIQIQQPVAKTKETAIFDSNQQKHQICRPQQLQVSSQSAFTSVERVSTRYNNNFLDRSVVQHGNQIQPVSKVMQVSISQLKHGEAGKQPYQILSEDNIQQHQPNNMDSTLDNRGRHAPVVSLRQSNNPFLSCQIGYQQYRPEPTYVQSLPYLENGIHRSRTESRYSEISNLGVVDNRLSVKEQQTEVSNGIGQLTFNDLEDITLLTPKQIEGSKNVLRLVFGDYDESSDEDLL